MSPSQNKIPPELKAQIDQLKQQVRHAEDHGQFDTAHHTMLKRVLKELDERKEIANGK